VSGIGTCRGFAIGFSKRPDASTALVYAAEGYPAIAVVLDPSAWYMTVGDRDV
jgi:hypothetical protein